MDVQVINARLYVFLKYANSRYVVHNNHEHLFVYPIVLIDRNSVIRPRGIVCIKQGLCRRLFANSPGKLYDWLMHLNQNSHTRYPSADTWRIHTSDINAFLWSVDRVCQAGTSSTCSSSFRCIWPHATTNRAVDYQQYSTCNSQRLVVTKVRIPQCKAGLPATISTYSLSNSPTSDCRSVRLPIPFAVPGLIECLGAETFPLICSLSQDPVPQDAPRLGSFAPLLPPLLVLELILPKYCSFQMHS